MTAKHAVKFRKLPARAMPFMLPLAVSVVMSCIVSGVATFHNLGFVPHFTTAWMEAWRFSWMIAYPTLLVVMPVMRRFVLLFVEHP